MEGKDVECRRLLQELCSAGEVQNRARGGRNGGAERYLYGSWYCIFLLSSGSWCTQGFICALQESVSQSCVSSAGSMVGLMVTSSKRAYA